MESAGPFVVPFEPPAPKMKPRRISRNTAGLNRGWCGPRDRREGVRQRRIRWAFIGHPGAVLSTRDLLALAWPRLDLSSAIPEWRWKEVRRAARRYADPILDPRSCPLRWRAKALADLLAKQR